MPSTRRAALVVTSLVVVASASAQVAPPSWTVTYKTSIDSGSGHVSSSTVRFQMAGRKVRMEITQATGAMGAAMSGMYMIAAESDSTITAVMPGQQMAMIMNPPGAQAYEFIRKHLAVADLKIDRLEDLGASEALLTHPTHHYRMTQSSTTNLTLPGQTCSRRQTSSTEMWMAADVDATAVFQMIARRFSAGESDPSLKAMTFSQNAGMPKGTALRSVSTTGGGDSKGADDKVVTTFEITELSNAPIDSSAFAVPASFQSMDMRSMATMPPATMDSLLEATLVKSMKGACAPRKDP